MRHGFAHFTGRTLPLRHHGCPEQGTPERGRLGLGDLVPGRAVSGIVTGGDVAVVAVRMFGPTAAQVTYRRPDGTVEERILYEEDAERLAEVTSGTAGGGLDADPGLFRLVAHQIQAVYNELLPRTPLRFLLADDPGAGKTIMAGLYIKELALRGDLERCLIVAPGGLVEQWQDELLENSAWTSPCSPGS